jgi:hypothetical protein
MTALPSRRKALRLSVRSYMLDPSLTRTYKRRLFGEDAVRREKRLLIERMESEINDKRVFALRRCEQLMCAGNPTALTNTAALTMWNR